MPGKWKSTISGSQRSLTLQTGNTPDINMARPDEATSRLALAATTEAIVAILVVVAVLNAVYFLFFSGDTGTETHARFIISHLTLLIYHRERQRSGITLFPLTNDK